MNEKIENDETQTIVTRREKIKAHFANHKEAYICGAAGIGIGAAGALLATKSPVNIHTNIASLFSWHSTNDIYAPVVQEVIRRGNPGQIVERMGDGLQYPSVREAAKQIGCSRDLLQRHLRGDVPDIFGTTYRVLGDAGYLGEPIRRGL